MNTARTNRYPLDPTLSQYFASIAHLPFKERLSRSRADLPRQEESRSPLKLSREEAIAKYGARPDPLWTPEVEAEFFRYLKTLRLPVPKMSPTQRWLVKEFAGQTLKAKRISEKYLHTLWLILSSFAKADKEKTECLVPQRSEQYGEPQTIRTIQTQMLNAGLLVKQVRTQGHGFVGSVFVYSPKEPSRFRWGNPETLEADYRKREGEKSYSSEMLPSNLSPEDVPF